MHTAVMHMERVEKDLLGAMAVPEDVYYGIQTVRALANFPISGYKLQPAMIHALGLVKKACARANFEVGLLPEDIADAIIQASDEVASGRFDDEFPGGPDSRRRRHVHQHERQRSNCQPGVGNFGPSSRSLRHRPPERPRQHVPIDQRRHSDGVSRGAPGHVAACGGALEQLAASLSRKASEFGHILKVGRTHLQDAVPLYLGQEFGAYARVVTRHTARLRLVASELLEVNLGATAVGTGLNAPPEYAEKAVALLGEWTGHGLRQADDLVDATQNADVPVAVSGELRATAVSLSKIASDLRLMASGPRAGLGELTLPAVQPGSSIMPGKVNPVMAELMNQVAFQVQGNDWSSAWPRSTVSWSSTSWNRCSCTTCSSRCKFSATPRKCLPSNASTASRPMRRSCSTMRNDASASQPY